MQLSTGVLKGALSGLRQFLAMKNPFHCNISRERKELLRWNKKHFFINFKGLSMKQTKQIFWGCSQNIHQVYRRTLRRTLFCNFIESKLRHGRSPANLLHNFRTNFPKNISGGLLLSIGGSLQVLSTAYDVYTGLRFLNELVMNIFNI